MLVRCFFLYKLLTLYRVSILLSLFISGMFNYTCRVKYYLFFFPTFVHTTNNSPRQFIHYALIIIVSVFMDDRVGACYLWSYLSKYIPFTHPLFRLDLRSFIKSQRYVWIKLKSITSLWSCYRANSRGSSITPTTVNADSSLCDLNIIVCPSAFISVLYWFSCVWRTLETSYFFYVTRP